MVGFFFQADNGFIVLHVGGEDLADAPDRVVDDAIVEEGGIRQEFAHPRHIRSLGDGPLQYVGLLDATKSAWCGIKLGLSI